ncbi:MFS transporter [Actinopolymorpha sp. B17G11]|uniref:MFS transporter n=1 Tax=Actinopolymorpha sp. B17G11 TaxID=3160861 RepID=UPI0032E46EA5
MSVSRESAGPGGTRPDGTGPGENGLAENGLAENGAAEGAAGERLLGPTYRSLTIGIVALVLLVAFEAMAVTTVMPVAVRQLDGLAFYAWAFSGFMTASMFATIVAGEVCDRIGPVVPFVVGVLLFTVGLVVAGVAETMLVFLVGRMIQGLGGGALVVTLYVIVGRAFPGYLRPRVFAAISSAWVLPSIVGPVIAGSVTEQWSWRLVFLGLVPVAIAPVALVLPRLRGLPVVPPAARRQGRKRRALAAAVGIGLLQYAGQRLVWWSLLLLAVGLALMVISLPRLLPPGTLRFARGLPSVVGMRGLFAGAFFGAQAFIPLMLVEHRGWSTTVAGLTLTVGALGWSTAAWWQGRPSVRTSRPNLIKAGATFLTCGLVLVLCSAFPAVPGWVAAPGCVLSGLGMGLAMASLSVLLLEYAPTHEHGASGAAAQMADSLGNVSLVGGAGVIFALLHDRADPVAVFVAIDAVMIAVAVATVLLALRVRQPDRLDQALRTTRVTSTG